MNKIKTLLIIEIIMCIFVGCANDEGSSINAESDVVHEDIEEQVIDNEKNINDISEASSNEEHVHLEILGFEEIEEKPEIDAKLANAIEIYDDEIEGDISNYIDENSGSIRVSRKITKENHVIYKFYDGEEELFETTQFDDYNSFEYIQFCDINSDSKPEILVASYVQNSLGYEVREFYVYTERDTVWAEMANFNQDTNGDIRNLLESEIDVDNASLDVELCSSGVKIIACIGNRASDEDGVYWEWSNYQIIISDVKEKST
ncbi:MAG: hypothetical protein IJ675_04300 [Pseudobutyrivibrio sp.]|nr:hypothetical protein [Pseudobutyrivibrio sp.]